LSKLEVDDSKEESMRYVIAAILAPVIAIPALAQTLSKPPSAGEIAQHKVKTLTALLNLTSAQQQQAQAIYGSAAQSEQTLLEGEKEAREALRAAVRNDDTSAIDQVAAALGQSMAENTSIRAKADAAFYQILTAEQQSKLSDLESQHLGPFDLPFGPGGPPAMGFH
jgi:Spy/CpxP family protein refolding chaperone